MEFMAGRRVNPNDLRPGPIRHEQLPTSLIARIETLRSTLEEVYPQSMAEWLDGFQRDLHPEPEVSWWERLARCYVEYAQHQQLQVEQRKAAFRLMLKLGLGASAKDLTEDLTNLSPGALDEIVAIMRSSAR
jgi:hypothetical protein